MMYDVAIIGGGPAGYSAAFEAVKNGLSVVLFEERELGGTCLNRGCIPTKFLVHTSDLYSKLKDANKFGITVNDFTFDYDITRSEMFDTVQKLRDCLINQLKDEQVHIVEGSAIVGENKRIICNGETYQPQSIILATGSNPAKPIIDGAHTSDEALQLDHIPKKVKILGGGVVAIEFANIFNKLGSDVTINIRGDRLLRKWDKEIALSIAQNLKKNGVKIKTKCSIEDFNEGAFDFILSAVGREPRTGSFAGVGIELDEKGFVIVNDKFETSIDGIYAAGDVISGNSMLAHTAMEQGRNIVKNIVGIKDIKESVISNCIYIDPEVSWVGMSESAAKDAGYEVVAAKINMVSNAMTLIHTDRRSFIKVIADKNTHQILGLQLMCERASDISSEFVVAINNQLTVEDIKNSLHPHPSFSEAIYDVMVALEKKINEL